MFIWIIKENINGIPGDKVKKFNGVNLMISPKNKANAIFESGPAMATLKEPHFWSLKLQGLIGTGFAQPTNTGLPLINKINGKIIEPNKSKCFSGFKVSRPAYFAVGSPSEKATLP